MRAEGTLPFEPELYTLGASHRYDLVCKAPCDPVLPHGIDVYVRIDRDGEPIEKRLWPNLGPEADLTVSSDTRSTKKLGWFLLVAGAAASIAAGVGYAVISSQDEKPGSTLSPQAGGALFGIPVGAVGLGMLIPGIVLVAAGPSGPSVDLARHRVAR